MFLAYAVAKWSFFLFQSGIFRDWLGTIIASPGDDGQSAWKMDLFMLVCPQQLLSDTMLNQPMGRHKTTDFYG